MSGAVSGRQRRQARHVDVDSVCGIGRDQRAAPVRTDRQLDDLRVPSGTGVVGQDRGAASGSDCYAIGHLLLLRSRVLP
jgi:hypothetical protein